MSGRERILRQRAQRVQHVTDRPAAPRGGTLRLGARPQGGLRVVIELPSTASVMPTQVPARPVRAGSGR